MLLFGLALSVGCAPLSPGPGTDVSQEPATSEQDMRGFFIIDDREGPSFLEATQLASMLAGADYILVGEVHTSPCDHEMQSYLLWTLADSGQDALVGLEMVDASRQDALDRFNRGELPVQGDGSLRQALDWDTTWGHPYGPYVPVFETARSRGLNLYGLNTPKDVDQAYRDAEDRDAYSDMDPELRAFLPPRIILSPEEQRSTLIQAMLMHSHARDSLDDAADDNRDETDLSPKAAAMLEQFIRVQSLWDSAMADRAVALHREHGLPVVVLAGTGHVEYGWGIAHRIRSFDPGGRIILAMPWRSVETMPDPSIADVFFLCPAQQQSRLGMMLSEKDGRVAVEEVEENSKAAAAGILPGDVITHAGTMAVDELADLHKAAMAAGQEGQDLELTLDRNGSPLTVSMPLGR